MKVQWEDRIKKVIFLFEDTDFMNANELLNMIKSPGWKIFTNYCASARELVLEKGKDHAKTKMRRDMCDNLFAFLDGFDTCMRMPSMIVGQAETMKDAIEKNKKEIIDEADIIDD